MSQATAPHLYLVDGSGFIFRAFHGLPPMSRQDGTPVNAVYGFTNMLMKLLEKTDACHLAVVFDVARTSFRSEIYPDYKAHRPPPPEELIPQFGLVREAVKAFNVSAIELEGYEADDLIATYASQAEAQGYQVTIVSSDKDLMQLVSDDVTMMDPMKEKIIGPEQVVEKFGVAPAQVIDVQALAGDSSDNVPGVPGIGVKTAAQLINEFGSLEALLDQAGTIKQPKRRQNLIEFADLARISQQLVRLKRDVAAPWELSDFIRTPYDATNLTDFLRENGFKSIISKLKQQVPEIMAEIETSGGDLDDNGADQYRKADFGPYQLLTSEEDLQFWIDKIVAAGSFAIDTETDSLSAMQANLVGISLSCQAGEAAYIPLGHGFGQIQELDFSQSQPQQLPTDLVLAKLYPLLTDPAILKIGHNVKYDLLVLTNAYQKLAQPDFALKPSDIAPLDDTLLLSYILSGGGVSHGMDDVSERELEHRPIAYSDVVGKGKSKITFDQVPLEKACDYAAEDADVTWRLYHVLQPRLREKQQSHLYYQIERPLVGMIAEMEYQGILINHQALAQISQEFATRMQGLEEKIHHLAGREFNVGSPKQLGVVLFDEMGLQAGKKTKTGAYSTNSEVLESLAGTVPIIDHILEWRMIQKLKSTYADALVQECHPVTRRIHTSYTLSGTNTGRLSSSDPNIQNIPIRTEEGRRIRESFIAPENNKLISIDYSQIELRLMAHCAELTSLQQAFQEGVDIHAHTAGQVFGLPFSEVSKDQRRQAKAINFGILYGISGFGLAKQLGCSNSAASQFIKEYMARMPELAEWLEAQKQAARDQGYVTTLFGRRCYIQNIHDRNAARRNFAERQAINAPIQGSAADIIKRAMTRLPQALDAAGLKAKILLQVHDELVLEAPDDQSDAVIAVTRAVMEQAPAPLLNLSVPLVAEAGAAQNWSLAH